MASPHEIGRNFSVKSSPCESPNHRRWQLASRKLQQPPFHEPLIDFVDNETIKHVKRYHLALEYHVYVRDNHCEVI